jgi:DNA-binding ferritin-like protein
MEPHNHPEYERTFDRIATILDNVAETIERLSAKLEEHIAHARERDDETTDKLDALIKLMDRHIQEHQGGEA